jgi:very-short-patch-repair endonuclease
MSKSPPSPRLRTFARDMRKEPTDAEAKMWRLLRDRRLAGHKFRRQAPFQTYILDFVCFEKRLVIEIDGSQHANSTSDPARDRKLSAEGFQIARYWNNDVLQQPTSVLEDVYARLTQEK